MAGRLRADTTSVVALALVTVLVVAAVLGPVLVRVGVLDPYTTHLELLNADSVARGAWGGMSSHHWLGVEPELGRDTLSRLWLGLSYSLGIALAATSVAVLLGVVLGLVAGMAGGWTDAVIGRLTDLTLAFPQTLLLLALNAVALAFLVDVAGIPAGNPAQVVYVVALLALFGWTGVARIVRSEVLSLRERDFVQAAMLLGASRWHVHTREVLPHLWPTILVQFTLLLPTAISAEAALSFLRVSVTPPTPTLGNVLTDGLRFADTAPLYFFAPAVLVAALVVALTVLGDGLRDALDPTSAPRSPRNRRLVSRGEIHV